MVTLAFIIAFIVMILTNFHITIIMGLRGINRCMYVCMYVLTQIYQCPYHCYFDLDLDIHIYTHMYIYMRT